MLQTDVAARGGRSDDPDLIMMDMPFSGAVVSVMSTSLGDASLYISSGGGVIGGAGHEKVRAAAKAFLAEGTRLRSSFVPAPDSSFPPETAVRFYLRTPTQLYLADAQSALVRDGTSPLAPLFSRAQDVITQLRLVSPQDGSHPPAEPRQRPDVRAYLNCLLTLMSEGAQQSVYIAASRPVPDLVSMSASSPDSRAQVESCRFDFAAIDATHVIRTLAEMAKLPDASSVEKRGEIRVVHALPDGRGVARLFDVAVAAFDGSITVAVAPNGDPRVVALQAEADTQAPGKRPQ